MRDSVTNIGEYQLSCTLSAQEQTLISRQFHGVTFSRIGRRFRAFFREQGELQRASDLIRGMRERS